MAALIQNEFTKLRSALPSDKAARIAGWTLDIKPCSEDGHVLWMSRHPGAVSGGIICLSPFAIQSLFIESSGVMPRALATCVKYGCYPFTFDGDTSKWFVPFTPDRDRVMAELYGQFSTLDSWVLRPFLGSLDFLLAKQIAEIYDPGAQEAVLVGSAASMLKKIHVQVIIFPLTNLLGAAIEEKDAGQWGLEIVGDGPSILARLLTLSS